MSGDNNLSQQAFPPSEPAENVQPDNQIGNAHQDYFFNVIPRNIQEPLASPLTRPMQGTDLNHSILAQNEFGRFAVDQIGGFNDQDIPQNQNAQQNQIFQQTFVFNMPTTVMAGTENMMSVSGTVATQNFTMAQDSVMSAMFGGFGGGMQNIQPGFDPIFQVLQASFNQSGRGNHHAASSLGLDSVIHLRILNDESVECPISAETLTKGEWASRMPCGHYFANESLAAWLEQHNTCPVCRFELHTGNPPVSHIFPPRTTDPL
jgi:hypothetical protein